MPPFHHNDKLKLNQIPTPTIADAALRALTLPHHSQGPSPPWDVLKARLPRTPRVFLLVPAVSVGDVGPFMRLVHDLAATLPGEYLVHRAGFTGMPFYDRYSRARVGGGGGGGGVVEIGDECVWMDMLLHAPADAVLSMQTFFLPGVKEGERDKGRRYVALAGEMFRRAMRTALEVKGTSIIPIGFPHIGPETLDTVEQWQKELETGKATLEEYQAWHLERERSVAGQKIVEGYRRLFRSGSLPGTVMLECYPAELMTERELRNATGYVSAKIGAEDQLVELRNFIAGARDREKKSSLWHAVDTASTDLNAIADPQVAAALAALEISVVAVGASGSKPSKISERIFCLPYLSADFSHVLSDAGLVVHHGGRGTTIMALQAGVPQVIVPNAGDTGDRIYHGARIAAIGCGRFVRPLPPLDGGRTLEQVKEVVRAVQDALLHLDALAETCLPWKATIHQGSVHDGVPVAVDAPRRLVAAAVVARRGR